MNQNYDLNIDPGRSSEITRAKGRVRTLASVATAVAVALCSSGVVSAEESQGHHAAPAHGSANAGHATSHSSFSYDFAELRYLSVTVDEAGTDLDGDGFEFATSVGLGDKFQAFALYEDIGFDHDIDLSEWAVGFGTHVDLRTGTDFVAQLGYISESIAEPGHATHDDEGYQLGIGIRQKIGERGELQIGVDYTDFSEAGSITSYEIAVEMHVLPALALGIGVDASDESTTYFAETRFYFGGH